jgi:chemotaxis response regulator CheB
VLFMAPELPEMDGLTTLRFLKTRSRVSVIVIAGPHDVESLLDALSLGACGYVGLDEPELREAGALHQHVERLLVPDPESIAEIGNAPDGLRATLVRRPRGRASGLGRLLRTRRESLGDAVHLLLDAPGWLVVPLARRLHMSTPWRVLAARDGDVLARGHVLVSTLAAGLVPVRSGPRLRLAHRGVWAAVGETVCAGSDAATPAGARAAVVPFPKWAT